MDTQTHRFFRARLWFRERWQDMMEDWEGNFILLALGGIAVVVMIGCR